MVDLQELKAQFRDDPLLTVLDGSMLLGGLVLSIASFLVLLRGLAGGSRYLWFAVIALGVFLVTVSNVVYPLWDRYFLSPSE